MDRREFLKQSVRVTGAVTLGTMASCGSPQRTQSDALEAPKNKTGQLAEQFSGHEALQNFRENGWKFVDKDGRDVNLATVEKWVGKSNSTLSFMLALCGRNVCPLIAANLEKLKTVDQAVKNIVVSTSPRSDYLGGTLQNIISTHHLEDNTYVLFPVGKETTAANDLITRLDKGAAEVGDIQHGLGFMTDIKDASSHDPSITLYDKSGKKFKEVDGTTAELLPAYQELKNAPSNGFNR